MSAYDRALLAAERVERLARALGTQRRLREACRTPVGAELTDDCRRRTEADLDAARAALFDALGEGLAELPRGEGAA